MDKSGIPATDKDANVKIGIESIMAVIFILTFVAGILKNRKINSKDSKMRKDEMKSSEVLLIHLLAIFDRTECNLLFPNTLAVKKKSIIEVK